MKHRLLLGAIAIAALAAVTSANAAVFEVSIVDMAYVPPTITIAVGDSIHWTNNGALPHTVTSGTSCSFDNDFDSGTLNPGQGFGYKADSEDAGLTKDYFCRFHCTLGMTGSYTVLQTTPAEQTSWGKIKSLYQ